MYESVNIFRKTAVAICTSHHININNPNVICMDIYVLAT